MLDLGETTVAEGAHQQPRTNAEDGERASRIICTLVPNSGLQFLDQPLTQQRVSATRKRFIEESGEDGTPSLNVASDDGGAIYHPITNEPCDPAAAYLVNGEEAVDAFLGQWLPIPFMRVSEGESSSVVRLEEGPSNWTRVLISRIESGDYQIVVAIDTATLTSPSHQIRGYTSPTLEDIRAGASYRFSDDVNDIAWFVSEAWVDEWIKSAHARQDQRDVTPGLHPLARYLTLLAVLREAAELPVLNFLPATSVGTFAETIPVDVAIDFGTARTAVMIEERQPKSSRAGSAEPTTRHLPLRHLSEPWRISNGPLPSDVAFHRINFGSEALSRWSGRANAFNWPSLVRTGIEARDLLLEDDGDRGTFGLSSPISYVWDERPSPQVWRFSRDRAQLGKRSEAEAPVTGPRRNPVVSGTILSLLSDTGDVVDESGSQGPTTKPRFSRSALLSLQTSEIVLQALSAINAPDWLRSNTAEPMARRLERIVVTPPPGMGETELAIFRRRIEEGIKLVWKSLGWLDETQSMVPPPPDVMLAVDTGTATQLAILENEIAHKFSGRVTGLLNLLGKSRSGFAASRTLRIATLDVGSASSGLTVATYEPATGNGLAITRHLVDGIDVGTDSVLQAISRDVLLPALERRLSECRHADAQGFFRALLTSDERARPSWVGDLGRRLAADVLAPAAWTLLQLSSGVDADAGESLAEATIGQLISSAKTSAAVTLDRVDVAAADDGADGFSPADVTVGYTNHGIAELTRRTLEPWLDQALRIIHALDCDLVLMTGAGADLRPVKDAVLAAMPLRPDRILTVSQYRFSDWLVQEADWPKSKCVTTSGALIQARGTISNGGPEIILREQRRASDVIFIGQLSADGRLLHDDVLFDLSTPDNPMSGGADTKSQTTNLTVRLPTLLGTRSTSLTRSPARPMWVIERSARADGRMPKLPVRLTLNFAPALRGKPMQITIVNATDRDGSRIDPEDLIVRLQTQRSSAGRWLDSGQLLDARTGGVQP